MLVSFRSARLHARVGGLDLPVLSFSGEEQLSRPSRFHLDILAPLGLSPGELLGRATRIDMLGPDGGRRRLGGILTACEALGRHPDGRTRHGLTVESELARLRLRQDTRIFLGQSLPAILLRVLAANGIDESRVRWRLSRAYPPRPWTLQVGESDLAFVARLLAAAGIFFWSEVEQDREILCFCDHNAQVPERPGLLRYRPGAGLEPQAGAIRTLRARHALTAERFEVLDRARADCAQALRAGAARSGAAAQDGKPIGQTHFAPGVDDPPAAQARARLLAEEAAARSLALEIETDVADLACGRILSLAADDFAPDTSGDYLVTGLRVRLSQPAGQQAAGTDLALSCAATLIRRETPFRPAPPPRPPIPFTFSARIESTGALADLDEQGHTRARAHFDESGAPHAQASIPLRRLSPHGGAPAEQPTGLHFPLRAGAEVLLSCLNNDPDRPVLIGALPNPATPSPVTSANPAHNILRSAADNQLLMDDARGQEVIRLSTFAGCNILELNAAALGQRIALASRQGALRMQAKKTLSIQCGDTLSERSGNDRRHAVENRHATSTRTGEIHHQAASDQRHQAAANLRMQSARNLEFTSAEHLRFDVARGQKLSVRGPEATFSVLNGTIHIQAAKDIEIRGQGGGDLGFAQNGGGFIVTAAGEVRIFGKSVSLAGRGGTSLNGPTSYQIGAAAAMPAVHAAAALRPRVLGELTDEGSACIVDLAWGCNPLSLGEAAEVLFTVKNFRGGETGEVRILETNADGSSRHVDQIPFTLDDGFGPYRLPWRRSEEQVREDLMHDANAHDPQPLTYVFEVAVGDTRSGRSDGLLLSTTLIFTPRNWQGAPLSDGGEYHLRDAFGRRHVSHIRRGELIFENVLVGPWQLLAAGEAALLQTQE